MQVKSVKNNYEKCPFYKTDSKSKICCQGAVDFCKSTTLFFNTPDAKDDYMQQFCRTYCYKGCVIAQAAEQTNNINE